MEIRDKIIQSVINKYIQRSDTGYKKYGVTLHEDDQPLDTWLKPVSYTHLTLPTNREV